MPRALLLLWVPIMVSCATTASRPDYPPTERVYHADVYHGVTVADPYRWLEDDVRQSTRVAAWVEAQNKVTFSHLDKIGSRDAIRRRLTELWDYERYSVPFAAGGRYFFFKNDGLQNQAVLYVMDRLGGEARVLIDPNAWSADGTVALDDVSASHDGKHLAYSVAEAGSDWSVWRVMEVESGKVLADETRWVKFGSPAWTHDGNGFFYARFPKPEDGKEFQGLNLNHAVYYHALGTPQESDRLVHHRSDEPEWGYGPIVTDDGRYLVVHVSKGTANRNRVLYQDLSAPGSQPVELIAHFNDEYSFVGNDGPVFYFLTTLDAPLRRVVAIDSTNPAAVREVIQQGGSSLQSASLLGNRIIATYLQDATSRVKVFDLDGSPAGEVTLPMLGTASGFGGRRADTETFYSFFSFTTPPTVYRYDIETGRSDVFRQSKVAFDPASYEVKQVFCKGKDGTRVPMFLAHRTGLSLNGANPTLLTGYGGFNIPLTPRFSISLLVWMEMGGVVAIPNLRGGGEYGEAWHQAGTKLTKQNTFDDFIAAAEWLIEHRYTRPSRLAIQGGSNGGLLVGAAMTQRPDLFGAALPAVGVMDMLRFHKFTAGRYWVDDYGSSDDPAEFKALHAYSPYHNLRPGTRYPATLVTTADTDDRVVPGHSFKFAAALQQAQYGEAPVLIRIETRSGHGAGTPTTKIIDRVADEWAFLKDALK